MFQAGSGIAFLSNGKTLITMQEDAVYFWEVATGKKLRRLKTIGSISSSIAISPDNKVLAAGGKYWDLTSDPPRQMKRQGVPLSHCRVAYSPDGRTVAWACGVRTDNEQQKIAGDPQSCDIYLVDASTGKVKRTLKDEKCLGGWRLAFSPDSKTLAAGAHGKTIVWDVDTGKKKIEFTGDGNPVTTLAFLSDGRTLMESRYKRRNEYESCLESGGPIRTKFLNIDKRRDSHLAKLAQNPNPYSGLNWPGEKCLSPNGGLLATNCGNIVSLWDMVADREVGPRGISDSVHKLIVSPDSKHLITLNPLQIWDVETGKLVKKPVMCAIPINPKVWYSDTHHIEIMHCNLSWPPKTASWDLSHCDIERGIIETEKMKLSAKLAVSPLSSGEAVSPDGRWLALPLEQGIGLIERATGKEVYRYTTQDYPYRLNFSMDGQSLLAQSSQCLLHVFSTVTGKSRMHLDTSCWRNSAAQISPQVLSPDGRWLAVVSLSFTDPDNWSGWVQMWDVSSGKEFGRRINIFGPRCLPSSFAWSPDNRLAAIGDRKGRVWLWDVMAGKLIRQFIGHRGGVTALAFTPDGLRLISGGEDTTALVWDITTLNWDLTDPSLREFHTEDQVTMSDLWRALRDKDPTIARRGINEMARFSDKAVHMLQQWLLQTTTPDIQLITLLSHLDDNNYLVRKLAEEKLKKLIMEDQDGRIMEQVQEALQKDQSLEVGKCINRILSEVLVCRVGPHCLTWPQIQACRGVEVLERIGTQAARQALTEISRLPTVYVQSAEAKAALQRLSKSSSPVH